MRGQKQISEDCETRRQRIKIAVVELVFGRAFDKEEAFEIIEELGETFRQARGEPSLFAFGPN